MSFEKCLAEIERVAGKLTDKEAGDLAQRVQDLVNRTLGEPNEGYEDAIRKATTELIEDAKTAAIIEKRNALFNKRAQITAYDYLKSTWGDNPAVGLKALLGGVNAKRKGARYSVATSQDELFSHYSTSMLADLEREGVHKFAVSGKFDDEIWKAMWELSSPEPNQKALSELQPESVKAAKILNAYNEKLRIDANQAGAWIKKLPGYVTKRTHDQFKIAKAAGNTVPLDDPKHFDTWKEFIADRLDWDRTLEGAKDRDKTLHKMFSEFASGQHIKFKEGGATGFKGFANVGKRMSQERVLHFKNAQAEFEYHQRFGAGNLMENIMWGMEHMARDTALMRHLGPNAEMNLDNVIRNITSDLNKTAPSKSAEFAKKAAHLKKTLWPNITGESQIAGSAMGAKVSSGFRAIEQMADLGASVLSAVSDVAFYASEVRFQGGSMLDGMAESMGAVFHGKSSIERKEILGELGVYIDSMRASVGSRFDVSDPVPGAVARANQIFFKLNFLRKWTDNQRSSFALASSHRLAVRSEHKFGELPDGLKDMLETFGIDEGKWDIYRKGKTKEADGREYLTPEGMDDVADDVFASYLSGKGVTPSPAKIRDLRTEIKSQFRSYFFDRATTATLEPNKLTRAILLQGTRPGTKEGEALRHIMLYKSFTASVVQKVLGRELYGYGADALPVGRALLNLLKHPVDNGSALKGLANVIVMSTIMGYAAMSLKDIAKGRQPRVPTDAAGFGKVLTAAMVQGGGLGIYGDFLFGEMKNRFGGNALTTFLGPTARRFTDVADLYGTLVSPDKDAKDAGAKVFNLAMNNTPFLNLFYLRWAVDYGLAYQFREWMNPGYLRRMERRLKREQDQEFIVPPSQVVK